MAKRKRKVPRLPSKTSLKGAWEYLTAIDHAYTEIRAILALHDEHYTKMKDFVQGYADDVKKLVGGTSKRLDLMDACLRAWGPPYWSAPQRPALDASEE